MENYIKASWIDLLKKSCIEYEAGMKLFGELTFKYQESTRYYHNLEHISTMLRLSKRFPYSIALQWAI